MANKRIEKECTCLPSLLRQTHTYARNDGDTATLKCLWLQRPKLATVAYHMQTATPTLDGQPLPCSSDAVITMHRRIVQCCWQLHAPEPVCAK